MADHPIGDLIDSLGVGREPRDGELVCGAVVLLKIVASNGDVSMGIAWSDGMSWIERVGMLRVAELEEAADTRDKDDDN